MDMEVEDVLPPRRPVRLRQVEPIRSEFQLKQMRDSLRHHDDGGSLRLRDVPDVGGVYPRNDEGVALAGPPSIEERQRAVILSHYVCGRLTGDDPAEDAIGHGKSLDRALYLYKLRDGRVVEVATLDRDRVPAAEYLNSVNSGATT
jgi:hypothetical protein